MSSSTKRVLLAENLRGVPVVVGPVFTDKGLDELRALVEKHGWTVTGSARLVSKAQLEWDQS